MIELELGCARVVFTDRHGGVSGAPYDSLNLAGHVGDDLSAVTTNQLRLAAALDLPEPHAWVRPIHVHGATVLSVAGPLDPRREADGVATAVVGLPLVALGADCAPIALANDTAACALHAGWRGSAAGVVEAGVAAVRALGEGPVRAVIGPCICARHYGFGADDLDQLAGRLGPEVVAATDDGGPAFDLRAAMWRSLARAGVDDVRDVGVCTAESPAHYSHRRDGVTGRQAVVVVVPAEREA